MVQPGREASWLWFELGEALVALTTGTQIRWGDGCFLVQKHFCWEMWVGLSWRCPVGNGKCENSAFLCCDRSLSAPPLLGTLRFGFSSLLPLLHFLPFALGPCPSLTPSLPPFFLSFSSLSLPLFKNHTSLHNTLQGI